MKKHAVKFGITDNMKNRLLVNVLYVEADVTFSKIFKAILESQGNFIVDVLQSVENAQGKIKQQSYDVIISGYVFPEKDGLRFLTELRSAGDSTPFILFTEKNRAEIASKALNLGVDGFVSSTGNTETVFNELVYNIYQAVEKRRMTEALRKSEAELKVQFESSPDLIMVIDRNYRFVRMNHDLSPAHKVSDLIGKNALQFVPFDYRELCKSKLDACFATGELQEVQHKVEPGKWMQTRIVPLLSENTIHQLMIISADITKLKLTEDRLRSQMERDTFLLELYTKALHLTKDELYNYFLTQAVRLSGSTIGFFHFVSEDQKSINLTTWNDETLRKCTAVFDSHYHISQAGNWVECIRLKRPVIYNDFVTSPNQKGLPAGHVPLKRFISIPIIDDDKVKIVFGLGNKAEPYEEADTIQIQLVANELYKILKHRRLEEALHESEQKYRSQFEEAIDAIVLSDVATGKIIDCNGSACTLVGKEKSEIVGSNLIDLHPPGSHVEERSKLFRQHIVDKNSQVIEDLVITKSGNLKPVEIKASTFRFSNKVILQSIFRDITERKLAEEKISQTLESFAVVNEKLGMLGSLTRHDIRNKLAAINGNLYLLKKRLGDNNTITQYLHNIEAGIDQILEILDFARTYEQIGLEKLAPMDAGKVFDDAAKLSNTTGVKVINEVKGITVLADSLFMQFFYNLIDNSLKHGKTVRQIRLYPTRADALHLNLIYEDDGEGIPDKIKIQIFKDGFSTSNGSGYGLFIIQKIADVYGWTIIENGEPGKGARFVITIPLTAQ